jgi:hypothetical protein
MKGYISTSPPQRGYTPHKTTTAASTLKTASGEAKGIYGGDTLPQLDLLPNGSDLMGRMVLSAQVAITYLRSSLLVPSDRSSARVGPIKYWIDKFFPPLYACAHSLSYGCISCCAYSGARR